MNTFKIEWYIRILYNHVTEQYNSNDLKAIKEKEKNEHIFKP